MDRSSGSHTRRSSGTLPPVVSTNDQAAQAAASLQLLLREDRLLEQHGLTSTSSNPDKVAFSYASAVLKEEGESGSSQEQADQALQDVERKLALVESLAVKLSRTSPEAVAGHLLRLHGYQIQEEGESNPEKSTTTLAAIRDRADRLERQSDMLENVAQRVENSLTRGLTRMDTACTKLERVLTLSSTLKMILRLKFENSKLQDYDLEDLRDLNRAAASVAIVEELLAKPELSPDHKIDVVATIRPQAEATAAAVRQAAAQLLQDLYSQPGALQQLGGTLQVYYHLGELPDAVWKTIDHAHSKAETVSKHLWNPGSILNMSEQAKKTAKDARMAQKKLKQFRAEAAQDWANGILEVATQVRNLHRVLSRKTDPVRRQVFMDVVAAAPIPAAYAAGSNGKDLALFNIFWARVCRSLGDVLRYVLEHDQGKLTADVAGLYPAIRAAALQMLAGLQDAIPSTAYDESGSGPVAGLLGGSSMLDDIFLQGSGIGAADNPQAAGSADMWTLPSKAEATAQQQSSTSSTPSRAGVLSSSEWKSLAGSEADSSGLYPLQKAFLEACSERLFAPLEYMFPENVMMDNEGTPVSTGLSLLPSKYDVQRFDENIRQELSLADPREGGGDLTAVTMIAGCVVSMISQFCLRVRNAVSGVGEHGYVENDWSPSEDLKHDRKVVAIMFAMSNYLEAAPDKTFIAPYRPAHLPQHEEAATMCQAALAPALGEMDKTVKEAVLDPLCRALNRRIASVLAKMHLGVYLDGGAGLEDDSPAFVQKHLSGVFESISQNYLSKFPPRYAAVIASTVASFSTFAFLSNVALLRPLGESARLHVTQDLADFELAMEQLVSREGESLTFSAVDGGKPYAELRAVRQMLFWAGLESRRSLAQDVAKSLLREVWVKDIRVSTVCHYLFSFAPGLLSSPHHAKRVKVEEYVSTLVQLDGSVEAGEESAWMMIVSCADSYKERATAGAATDGDARIADIVLPLGQELRRRRS